MNPENLKIDELWHAMEINLIFINGKKLVWDHSHDTMKNIFCINQRSIYTGRVRLLPAFAFHFPPISQLV